MLYPQPQHFMPAPYPNLQYPMVRGMIGIIDAEPITANDLADLLVLVRRRKVDDRIISPHLQGTIRQQGNYTIATLGFSGRCWGIGIAKRNPNDDPPDPLRGRQIALARAMFDLLRAEGRKPEPENREGALIHAGNSGQPV